MKQKKCKVCGTEFVPQRTTQSVCDWKCALELQHEKAEKKQKREIREQKQKLKTKSEYVKEAQASFNRYIRQRDIHLPCISCSRFHQGQWHAGHYRTTAAAPQLRFNEDNVHRQCAPCNNHKSGDIVNYRQELLNRIGAEKVEKLETNNDSASWTVEELVELKKEYNKKYRELL